MSPIEHICLLGFGEVGQTLAADFQAAGIAQLTAFDLLFKDPASAVHASRRCGGRCGLRTVRWKRSPRRI